MRFTAKLSLVLGVEIDLPELSALSSDDVSCHGGGFADFPAIRGPRHVFLLRGISE